MIMWKYMCSFVLVILTVFESRESNAQSVRFEEIQVIDEVAKSFAEAIIDTNICIGLFRIPEIGEQFSTGQLEITSSNYSEYIETIIKYNLVKLNLIVLARGAVDSIVFVRRERVNTKTKYGANNNSFSPGVEYLMLLKRSFLKIDLNTNRTNRIGDFFGRKNKIFEIADPEHGVLVDHNSGKVRDSGSNRKIIEDLKEIIYLGNIGPNDALRYKLNIQTQFGKLVQLHINELRNKTK